MDREKDSDISHSKGYGSTDILYVTAGKSFMDVDVGLVAIGSMGDFVWEDTNADGIQQTTEKGMNGINVRLYNRQGEMVDSTTTQNLNGESGYYLFDDLTPGGYYLEVEIDEDYIFSEANVGGDDTKGF